MPGTVREIQRGLARAIAQRYQIPAPEIQAATPPDPAQGDLAFTICFELARQLKCAPRRIAMELLPDLQALTDVKQAAVAGAGYLNVFLDRRRMLLIQTTDPGAPPLLEANRQRRTIVEHTNINPNKAAHVGHLRNAVLGDTLVRCLRYLGCPVEVQNYIDDTGVQVADLVVGFQDLETPQPDEIEPRGERFDHACWDLYARVHALQENHPQLLERRSQVLKQMEAGHNETAALAADVVQRIVACHLATMRRLDIRYDLLPRESDILQLSFWARAFEMLKEAGAISRPAGGRHAGCWVMDLAGEAGFEDIEAGQKVLVRSSGTVTYTGKDIAYQLWKFGLLGKDFNYRRMPQAADGQTVWSTTSGPGEPAAPSFGRAAVVYNVIDQRQAYPQKVVARGLAALGFKQQAKESRHFAYEMVALTPDCAREMGMELDTIQASAGQVEMSGRKGLGVKADDLLDRLEERAAAEVGKRNPDLEPQERDSIAHLLAVGALRYFMLRFTRNRVIALDFNEVLSFEGETGPYVQYSVVRAGKILAKLARTEGLQAADIPARAATWLAAAGSEPPAPEWKLARACGQVGEVVVESVDKQDLAGIARHAFTMAQIFNSFYHRFPVLQEPEDTVRRRRILLVDLFRRTMIRTLDLMGIPVPPRM